MGTPFFVVRRFRYRIFDTQKQCTHNHAALKHLREALLDANRSYLCRRPVAAIGVAAAIVLRHDAAEWVDGRSDRSIVMLEQKLNSRKYEEWRRRDAGLSQSYRQARSDV
jgi:hypothetical protein